MGKAQFDPSSLPGQGESATANAAAPIPMDSLTGGESSEKRTQDLKAKLQRARSASKATARAARAKARAAAASQAAAESGSSATPSAQPSPELTATPGATITHPVSESPRPEPPRAIDEYYAAEDDNLMRI